MDYLQHVRSWLGSMEMPSCLFNSNGAFILSECKLLGLGFDAWAGLLGISAISLIGLVWWFFRPLVSIAKKAFQSFYRQLVRRRIRPASGARIAVLLTRLEGDDEIQSQRESISDAIKRELGNSVEIIKWPDVVQLGEGNDFDLENKGFTVLQRWLKAKSCDIAIWGRVKTDDIVSLRFTISEFGSRLPESYKLTDTLELPRKFIQSLGLAIAIRVCAPIWSVQPRSDLIDYLRASAARLDAIIRHDGGSFDPEIRASLIVTYGRACLTIGLHTDSVADIERAVIAFEIAIGTFTKDRWPDIWESLSINLASTLLVLGERQGSSQRLEQSRRVYLDILERTNPATNLIKWGAIRYSLATVLVRIGERQSSGPVLQEAIDLSKDALAKCTRDKTPWLWAYLTNNLGLALYELGELETSQDNFESAINYFLAALEEWKRDRAPHLWATTQNSLCNVYRALGERTVDAKRLTEAIKHGRNSLKERKRETEPLEWGHSQNNLGISYLALAKVEERIRLARKALAAVRLASIELTRERSLPDWLMVQINLGHALLTLGGLSQKSKYLWQAIRICDHALLFADPAEVLFRSAILLNNIGSSHTVLFQLIGRIESCAQAFRAHTVALQLYKAKNSSYQIDRTLKYSLLIIKLLGGDIVSENSRKSWLTLMETISLPGDQTNKQQIKMLTKLLAN